MKRLFLTALCVLFVGMCTCTAQYRYLRSVARRVYSEQAAKGDHYARYKLSAMNIKCEYCIHSGAYVRHGNKFCFSIEFGTIKLKNTELGDIEVYEYDPARSEDWLLQKKISRDGPFEDILTYKNKRPLILTFRKISSGEIYMYIYTAQYRKGAWCKEQQLTYYIF